MAEAERPQLEAFGTHRFTDTELMEFQEELYVLDDYEQRWDHVPTFDAYVAEVHPPDIRELISFFSQQPWATGRKYLKRVKRDGDRHFILIGGVEEVVSHLHEIPIPKENIFVAKLPSRSCVLPVNVRMARALWPLFVRQTTLPDDAIQVDSVALDVYAPVMKDLIDLCHERGCVNGCIFLDSRTKMVLPHSLTFSDELSHCPHPLRSLVSTSVSRITMHHVETNASDYLCNELDLLIVREPNIYESMQLVHARTRRVFFALSSPDTGGFGSVASVHLARVNHKVYVAGGLLERYAARTMNIDIPERPDILRHPGVPLAAPIDSIPIQRSAALREYMGEEILDEACSFED